MRRQPEREDRGHDQDDEADQVGDDERDHAAKDRGKVDVGHHAFYHEHDHADRRMDQPEFDRHDDDDAEPDRIEAQFLDDRKDDRHGQDDHGKRIHQAAQHDVHHHDERQ